MSEAIFRSISDSLECHVKGFKPIFVGNRKPVNISKHKGHNQRYDLGQIARLQEAECIGHQSPKEKNHKNIRTCLIL